jgi:hypothetical protein
MANRPPNATERRERFRQRYDPARAVPNLYDEKALAFASAKYDYRITGLSAERGANNGAFDAKDALRVAEGRAHEQAWREERKPRGSAKPASSAVYSDTARTTRAAKTRQFVKALISDEERADCKANLASLLTYRQEIRERLTPEEIDAAWTHAAFSLLAELGIVKQAQDKVDAKRRSAKAKDKKVLSSFAKEMNAGE